MTENLVKAMADLHAQVQQHEAEENPLPVADRGLLSAAHMLTRTHASRIR